MATIKRIVFIFSAKTVNSGIVDAALPELIGLAAAEGKKSGLDLGELPIGTPVFHFSGLALGLSGIMSAQIFCPEPVPGEDWTAAPKVICNHPRFGRFMALFVQCAPGGTEGI